MKNNKLAESWDNLAIDEETENRIYLKIKQKLQPQKQKHTGFLSKLKLKPVLITAIIFVMLITTVVATTPFILNLNFTAKITQDNINYIAGLEHNITIESISISSDGNFLTITEKGGENELNSELFCNFFVVDDKNNSYVLADLDIQSRREWENDITNDITYKVKFCGSIPDDAQYLKVIPYNYKPIPEILADPNGIKPGEDGFILSDEIDPRELYLESKAYISELPKTLKQNEYGNVLIENCVVTKEDIVLTYKCEGMVKPLLFVVTDGKSSISPYGQLSFQNPVYDCDTGSFTQVFKITNPNKPIETAKGLKVIQYDIELLEEQAIIIPLR